MKKIKLVRYGNVNPIKQTHYVTNYNEMTYHGAPEKYGFYTFLYPYIETFLLGGTGKDIKTTTRRMFTVDGYIWTHLEISNAIEQRGSWFKVHSKDFLEYFPKYYASEVKYILNLGYQSIDKTLKNPFRFISKDHLEIFVPHYTKLKNLKIYC